LDYIRHRIHLLHQLDPHENPHTHQGPSRSPPAAWSPGTAPPRTPGTPHAHHTPPTRAGGPGTASGPRGSPRCWRPSPRRPIERAPPSAWSWTPRGWQRWRAQGAYKEW